MREQTYLFHVFARPPIILKPPPRKNLGGPRPPSIFQGMASSDIMFPTHPKYNLSGRQSSLEHLHPYIKIFGIGPKMTE